MMLFDTCCDSCVIEIGCCSARADLVVFLDCYDDVPEVNCSAVDGYIQYPDGRCLASRDDNTTYLAGVWDAQLARDDANVVRTFSSMDYFKYETAAVELSSNVEQFTLFH